MKIDEDRRSLSPLCLTCVNDIFFTVNLEDIKHSKPKNELKKMVGLMKEIITKMIRKREDEENF